MRGKVSRYWAKQYKIRKLMAIEYKGGKCQKCGYDKCPAAMEFHHRNPDNKEFDWTKIRRKKWEMVLTELDKCDLLCANCHRETHYDSELWKAVVEWRQRADAKKLPPVECETCKGVFKPHVRGSRYCSVKCGAKQHEVIGWPHDLPDLVRASSKSAVARSLGVSDKAVAKRLRNHHGL